MPGRVVMRYPIFLFDGEDLIVFNTPKAHWDFLESYDLGADRVFDSEGRQLTEADAGNDRVRIQDSGAEPNPERLRGMLLRALRRRGKEFDDEASLGTLVAAAQRECGL